jgi:hypothetical protein
MSRPAAPARTPGRLNTATATLQPSGATQYQADYLFRLEPFAEPLVVNAPYSADEVQRITQGASNASLKGPWHRLRKIDRDAAGRTRVERPFSLGLDSLQGRTHIQIFDPASGWAYVLDPQLKIAHRYHPSTTGPSTPESSATPPIEVATATPGQPIRRSTLQISCSGSEVRGTHRNATRTTPPENLGDTLLDGLPVHGVQYVTPVQSSDGTSCILRSEIWTSPSLYLVVLSKSVDQETESTVRLIHLTQAEPNLALFEIPPSYKLQNEATDFHIHVTFSDTPQSEISAL